jgi:hypothetical protein
MAVVSSSLLVVKGFEWSRQSESRLRLFLLQIELETCVCQD